MLTLEHQSYLPEPFGISEILRKKCNTDFKLSNVLSVLVRNIVENIDHGWVIFHKQSKEGLRRREELMVAIKRGRCLTTVVSHSLISPHSCSLAIARHKSFSRLAYTIIFFTLSFACFIFPQRQHLFSNDTYLFFWFWLMRCLPNYIFAVEDHNEDDLNQIFVESVTLTMWGPHMIKFELVPNLIFANYYLFRVHFLICFSCEWAPLAQLVFARKWEWLWCTTNSGPLCTQVGKYSWESEKYSWEIQDPCVYIKYVKQCNNNPGRLCSQLSSAMQWKYI